MNQEFNIFLDTNILIHASLKDFEPEKYKICSEILSKLHKYNYKTFISTQIIREFFAIVTNKKYIKNPLSIEQANNQIKIFQFNYDVLIINEDVINCLIKLTEKYNITGQKVHDTTIVATMINYDITNIITYNNSDFKSFKEIKVINPNDDFH